VLRYKVTSYNTNHTQRRKRMVKRLIIGSAFLVTSMVAISATWTDSTGNSVIDGAGADRTSRGTITGGVLNTSIDMDALQVMSSNTSKALTDLAHLIADDGQALASCQTDRIEVKVIQCPSYAGSNCQALPRTGLEQLTASYDVTYRLWSWNVGTGFGSYGHALTYTNKYLVSYLNYDAIPSDQRLGVTKYNVYVPSKAIEVVLSQSGYMLKVNGQNGTATPVGDLSLLGNTRFTNLTNAGKAIQPWTVANYPRLTVPRIKFRYYTTKCSGGKANSCNTTENNYLSNIDNAGRKNPYFRVGYNNAYPAGQLSDIFTIYDIEHITSGGKYTNTIRISLEVAQIKNGSNYYTYYEGQNYDSALLEYWGDKNKGETDFDYFLGRYNYSAGTPPKPFGADIKTPYRKVITCTLK
jgi:hypothetical protein